MSKRLMISVILVLCTLPAQAADSAALRDSLRLRALDLVNRERTMHGLPTLGLDPFASLLADRFCEQQLRDRTVGHFSVDGIAPYMRYPWGGTRDMLRENVAAWSANYPFEMAALPDLVGRSHRTMMNEKPPDDGHRRAILDPFATHMGFGIAWDRGELRFAQLFLRKAIDWSGSVASSLPAGAPAPVMSGKPHHGHTLEGVSMHWEPLPSRLTRSEIESREDYRLPAVRRDYSPGGPTSASPLAAAARDLRTGDLVISSDGSFRFQPVLDRGPGVYTAVFWVRHRGRAAVAAGLTSFRVNAESGHASGAR